MLTLAAIVSLLLPVGRSFAQIDGVQVLKIFAEKDTNLNAAGIRISFVIATEDNPFSDPNQGLTKMRCEATQTLDSFAMKVLYDYERSPVFAPSGRRGYAPYDYDPNGNLIVWRTLQEYVLSTSKRNGIIEKLRMFLVAPSGETVKTHDNTILHLFPIGSSSTKYKFSQFQQALGRGFAKHVTTVKSLDGLPAGLIEVTARGSYGTSLVGTWELTLDPNSYWLVRKGIFTRDGGSSPTVTVTSVGAITKDGLEMAKYGVYTYSNLLQLFVEVTDICRVVGRNDLYEEVCLCFDERLPVGSAIIDFQGQKPVRTTVK